MAGYVTTAGVSIMIFMLLSAAFARPRADSAGIVPLVDGLAYGGIPYGSVTGMVAEYYRNQGDLERAYQGVFGYDNEIYLT